MRARPARKEPTLIRGMTHVCCPRCRLLFTPAAAAYIIVCPECGDSPQRIASLERSFGFRLVGPEDLAPQRQANDAAQRAHHAFESRPDGQTPAGDLADFVPATEEPFPAEHSDAALGAPRSRRSAPHAHHVRDRVQ
jgi:hypothetical protein